MLNLISGSLAEVAVELSSKRMVLLNLSGTKCFCYCPL